MVQLAITIFSSMLNDALTWCPHDGVEAVKVGVLTP